MVDLSDKIISSSNNYFMCSPKNIDSVNYALAIVFKTTNKRYITDDSYQEDFVNVLSKTEKDNLIYIIPFNIVLDDTTKNDYVFYEKVLAIITNISKEIMNKNPQINKQVIIMTKTDEEYDFADWVHNGYKDFSQEPFTIKDLREKRKSNIDEYEVSENGGDTPLTFNGSSINVNLSYSNKPKVKKMVPIKSSKKGFTNILFLSLVIVGSLIFGIGFAWLLIK